MAIIGCQSSGKSTLLNRLFDTKFEEMDENRGRGQTTKGIWLSVNTELKSIVIDCEGTDSKERGEDRHQFEHCSSLFCLALADLLIINMWTSDIGRYTASNYGVLKIVFEMNLKLFQQECAKKILIVLRDYDEKRNKKEAMESMILKDIQVIWNDIRKPDKFKSSNPSDFFEFEFVTLPHKFYREEQFETECKHLKERLKNTNPNYLFSHSHQDKNVPADGFTHFCEQVWDTIIKEKDLNIPSQKEMLANYRCNEIKEEALRLIDPDLKTLMQVSKEKRITNFKSQCKAIFDNALKHYDATAVNYMERIYEEVRIILCNALSQNLYIAFVNQIKRVLPVAQRNLRHDFETDLKTSKNC